MGIHPQRKRCDPPADPFLKHQTVTTTSTTTTTVDPHASKRKYVVNPERYFADQCIYRGYVSLKDNDIRYDLRSDDSRCTCGEIALPSGTDLTVTINNVASGNFIHKNEVSVNSEKQLFSSASVDFSHGSELKPNNIKLTASESFDAEVSDKLLLAKNLQFSILSPEEIRKGSVAEITSRDTYINNKPVIGGLFDPRMGVLEPGLICPTDGLDYMQTPGYFGHINLSRPVFYIQYLNTIIKILRCTCIKCGKCLINKEKYKYFMMWKELE